MEKAQLIGFVGGDDKLIGHGRQTLDKTADEGTSRKGHRRLRLAHAPRLATGLDDHRDARPHVVLGKEIGQSGRIFKADGGNAIERRSLLGIGDIGHHSHRVGGRHPGRSIGGSRVVGRARHFARARHLARAVAGPVAPSPAARAVDRAPQLREVRRQRQTLPGRLHEQASRTAVGLVTRAHDLDGGQPAFAVALHHDNVVVRHRAHQLVALHLVFHGLDARHLPRGRNNRLGGAGGPVAVGVLAGNIDVEPAMGMVLDGAHVEPATHQLGDKPLDERRFAGVMPPHDGHSRTWNIDHSCYALP